MLLIACPWLALGNPRAEAVEYNGRVMLGTYQVDETAAKPEGGDPSNDQRAALGRAYFDATGIGPFRNEFVFDFRDRYEDFGKNDDQHLKLVPSNDPELRQLAVKYPFEGDKIFWSLGRFPVEDAGIVANDGAELGYKFAPQWRLGVFGGLVPDPRPGKSLTLTPDDREAGVYATYQSKPVKDWFQHAYFANGLVYRQTLEKPAILATGEPEPTNADGLVSVTTASWYSQNIYQPTSGTRLTSVSYVALAPDVYVRNLWASYFRQLIPSFSLTASVMRLDLTEYRKIQDIRETIQPAAYTQGKVSLLQKLSKRFALTGDLLYGTRADGLNKYELAPGARLTGLLSGRVSLSARGGYRKNFVSKDTFVIGSADYYAKRFELGLTQEVRVEKRDTGETYHPLITDLSISALIVNQLLGSLSLEYAKDERVTIMSGLVSVGFRFGSRQLTPFREAAPPLERVE